MKISCNIIMDLIPLVKDGVASDDSTQIVQKHVVSCKNCNAAFTQSAITASAASSRKDKEIISAIKQKIFITQLLILLAGAVIGIALTNSMEMFYNLLIMPVIGALSLVVLGRKWYLMPLFIFILSWLWQVAEGVLLGGFAWAALYYGVFYSFIYTFLAGLGIVITLLLKYVFQRER